MDNYMFSCGICNERFPEFSKLEEHMKIHNYCKFCEKIDVGIGHLCLPPGEDFCFVESCLRVHKKECVICSNEHCYKSCSAVMDVANSEWKCLICTKVHDDACGMCNAIHCPTTCEVFMDVFTKDFEDLPDEGDNATFNSEGKEDNHIKQKETKQEDMKTLGKDLTKKVEKQPLTLENGSTHATSNNDVSISNNDDDTSSSNVVPGSCTDDASSSNAVTVSCSCCKDACSCKDESSNQDKEHPNEEEEENGQRFFDDGACVPKDTLHNKNDFCPTSTIQVLQSPTSSSHKRPLEASEASNSKRSRLEQYGLPCSDCQLIHVPMCFTCNIEHCTVKCNIVADPPTNKLNDSYDDVFQDLINSIFDETNEVASADFVQMLNENSPTPSSLQSPTKSLILDEREQIKSNHEQAHILEMYKSRTCKFCNQKFTSGAQLDFHIQSIHEGLTDENMDVNNDHVNIQIGEGANEPSTSPRLVQDVDAWGLYESFKVDLKEEKYNDIGKLVLELKSEMFNLVKKKINEQQCIKWFLKINVHFYKIKVEGEEMIRYAETDPDPTFFTSTHAFTRSSSFDAVLEASVLQLQEQIDGFINKGSGWIFENVTAFSIDTACFNPFRTGKYIPLTGFLTNKSKSLLNIDNRNHLTGEDDGKCFLWSVLAHEEISHLTKTYGKNKGRYDKKVSTYKKHVSKVNVEGIEFPISEKGIAKFEKLNPNIAITVIGYEETEKSEKMFREMEAIGKNNKSAQRDAIQKGIRECVFPLYVSKKKPADDLIQVDLLQIIENLEDGSFHTHCCLITNLNGFLKLPNNRGGSNVCRNCLHNFTTPEFLDVHRQYCVALAMQKTVFPVETHYKFKKFERMIKVPFRYYADLESLLPKADESEEEKRRRVVQNHTSSGYCWTCVDWTGETVAKKVYRITTSEEEAVKDFLKDIIADSEIRYEQILLMQSMQHKSMKIDRDLQIRLKEQIQRNKTLLEPCYFCDKKFRTKSKVVFHHCHCTGEFLGLAHDECNKIGKMPLFFPVFMHNLKNYDAHFVIQSCNIEAVKSIDIIPNSSEKFMSFTLNNRLKFLDSFQFNSTSLNNLVTSLSKNGTQDFKITKSAFEGRGDVNLLFKKGAYPYSYMDCIERFKETKLPPIAEFYNDLADEPMDDGTYAHAQKVWDSFGIKNLGEWHDLYVELDVCLLADCMEKTRELLWNSYKLDLCHYFSLPMVSFDAATIMGKVKYEYLNSTMHCWFESGIRGGYCGVGGIRAANANNKYMGDLYKPEEETSFISYLDFNNLYGAGMLSYLPEKDFEWVEGVELEAIQKNPENFLNTLSDTSKTGYFFEVDLSVPASRHHELNDFPPAPNKRAVREEELGPHQLDQVDDLNISKACFKTEKLVADLHDKKNYVTHYRNLKMYVKLGLKIEKIHRIVKFSQRPWMSPYINFNTTRRALAQTDYEKDFYKLLNNSAFGKCCEQKRNRKQMVIIRSETELRRYINKPTFERIIQINKEEEIYIVVKKNLSVYLDKPMAVGVSVLEISKCFMYDFHYNYMVPKYGSRARINYSDTDSLIYVITGPTEFDFYKDMKENSSLFDMSDFKGMLAEFNDPTNKKVVGKMKDEFPNSVIIAFAAAKPKMYGVRAVLIENGIVKILDKIKAKGIPRGSMKQVFFDQFQQVLEMNMETEVYIRQIRSKLHHVTTEKFYKKALNGFDTKRLIIDAVTTLAHGHVDTKLYM